MCSSGGSVGKTDVALQKSQAAMTNTLNSDYSVAFAENQAIAARQTAVANSMIANPLGYTPQELATARTSINENTATAAKQALGAAGAFAAAHGGSDLGSGSIGQIAGEIGSAATQSKAQQLNTLSTSNEQLKRQNFYAGINELNAAGNNLSGQGSTAIGGAGSAASTSVGAGSGALAAQQAGWQDLGGVISGVAGLASAGAGVIDANPKGIFS